MATHVGDRVVIDALNLDAPGFDTRGTIERVNINYVYVRTDAGDVVRLERSGDAWEHDYEQGQE